MITRVPTSEFVMPEITLNLRYPVTPQYAAAHAMLCVEGAKQVDGIELDFSPESLEYLDEIVGTWRKEQDFDLNEVASVLFTFGCYVGEIFVRHAGAKWYEEDQTTGGGIFQLYLKLANGTVCRPIDKVFMLLEDASQGGLSYFYELYTGCDSSEEKELVPVLRTVSSTDPLLETAVSLRVADDLAVFACRKIITAEGNVGIDYVMKDQVVQTDVNESQIIEYCFENFFAGNIEVTGYEQDGDQMLEFTHEEGLASSIVGHPQTYEKFSELLDSKEVTVLIVNPDSVLATRTGSSFEDGLHKMAADLREQQPGAIFLIPAVYQWKDSRLVRSVL
jgi:hypothetical protein